MTRQEIYNKLREVFHSKSGCFLSKKSCEELAHEIYVYAETDYLLSSEANKEKLIEAIKEFEGDLTDVVNIAQTSGKQPADHLKNINLDIFDHEAQESEEEKKYYEGFSYDSYSKITPKDLLEIGFEECYQEAEEEEPGFIYYIYRVMNLDLTSVETIDPDFRVLVGDGEFPIRDLKQLSDLLNILEEVGSKKEEK